MSKIYCAGLCDDCYLQGFCQEQVRQIVSVAELENEAFRLDACNAVVEHVKDIPYRNCPTHFADWHMSFGGVILEANGEEASAEDFDALMDAPDEWWRDTFYRKHTHAIGLRSENRQRLRALFTLLRAQNPVKAALWGVHPANDNFRA
jgi:hypothetical protein